MSNETPMETLIAKLVYYRDNEVPGKWESGINYAINTAIEILADRKEPIRTATEILFEHGIDTMSLNDDFNTQLFHAMERYAEQFSLLPTEQAAPKRDEEIEQLSREYADETYAQFHFANGYRAGHKAALQSEKEPEDRWISVSERPLFTSDGSTWELTEDGEKSFIAAVPYHDRRKLGETLWWIHHCVIEDGMGLCVVGEDSNESAGWEMNAIEYWQPFPGNPHPSHQHQSKRYERQSK